ncbi:MAG: DNA polymerase III subunit delta [candidate division Zixibacteria bacterium]|nr:DNA polymerase III subunit delta [candidate division Zixibacteria bacterium]
MKYAEFITQIEKGKISPLYHFSGEEELLKREAVEKLIWLLIEPTLKSFNLDFVQARETKAEEIINLCATLPFGSKKRMVIVYDIQKLHPKHKDELSKYLPHIPESSCLILFSNKVDKRLKFYQDLKQTATEIEFYPLKDDEVSDWIGERVEKYRKKMEPKGVALLLEAVGNNLFELSNELEKLAIYVQDKELIDLKDIENVVGYTKTENVFQLNQAIGEKKLNQALKILKDLSLSKGKETSIIFMLGDHFLKLYQIKASAEKNMHNLAYLLRIYHGSVQEYQNQAKNFSLEQLEKGLSLIYQADLDLKSGKMPQKFIVELLIYELCRL